VDRSTTAASLLRDNASCVEYDIVSGTALVLSAVSSSKFLVFVLARLILLMPWRSYRLIAINHDAMPSNHGFLITLEGPKDAPKARIEDSTTLTQDRIDRYKNKGEGREEFTTALKKSPHQKMPLFIEDQDASQCSRCDR